jgi:hypothetical protein
VPNAVVVRLGVLLLTLSTLLGGCGGMTKVPFEVVAPDDLPSQVHDWRSLPPDLTDARDAVIDDDTYMRIVIGPCPFRGLKVRSVQAGGPHLSIESVPQGEAESQHIILYLKLDWKHRTEFNPQSLTLKVKDAYKHFYPEGVRSSGAEAAEYRPSVTYSGQAGCPGEQDG